MQPILFGLNLPWNMVGLLCGLASLPYRIEIHKQPLALIFHARSLWWIEWLPSRRGIRATATGNIIILGKRKLEKDLEHELVHVTQAMRVPFLHPVLYALESLRRGYRNNTYEIEAYRLAGNRYHE